MAFVKDLNRKSVRRAGSRVDILPTFYMYELRFRGESSYGIPRFFIAEVAALSEVEAWSTLSLSCIRAKIKFEQRIRSLNIGVDRSFLEGKTRRKPEVLNMVMRELESYSMAVEA